jgi:cytochrome bd-type quinol oxidase subunit 2
MTAGPAQNVGSTGEDRAQPPIRWPRPDRFTHTLGAVWIVGLVIALVVPALIVPPNSAHPSVGRTWFAFLFTAIGVAIMLTCSLLEWRRKRDGMVLTLFATAAIALFLGGIILVAAKLAAGYNSP